MSVANLRLVACQEPEVARQRAKPASQHMRDPKPRGVGVVAKHVLSLTSDAIVLTLAAPFFAVWWIVRTTRRLLRKA
jgi:hypothetical protein